MPKKILFVYDHNKPEQLEGDGLWSALKLLEADFEITKWNCVTMLKDYDQPLPGNFNFVLGWGAFDSNIDKWMQNENIKNLPRGLCLGGMLKPNETASSYDVIFYETEAHKRFLEEQGVKTTFVHAFGINTDIYKELFLKDAVHVSQKAHPKIWDNISVGSFSPWHRQDLLYDLSGYNLAVGNVETDNIQESFNYVANLLLKGWSVSNFVPAEVLAKLYNMSMTFVATADFGQERAVWEAKACGIEVIVPQDNPKLLELKDSPVKDHHYYAEQLKLGITEALK